MLDEHLHYRMIDVSSIKELCRRWYPRIYFGQPPKGMTHRALADITESIRELAYYRGTAFVPPPGPTPTRRRPSPPRWRPATAPDQARALIAVARRSVKMSRCERDADLNDWSTSPTR